MKNVKLEAVPASRQEHAPSVWNVMRCKCPRCRQGDMFVERNPYQLKTTMKMNQVCPVCQQPFDIEVGFYYGSSYISYGLSIGISVASLLIWWAIIGLGLNDNRFLYWLIVNAILLVCLQPPLMRVARSVWLAFFVRYNRNWKQEQPEAPERINKEQMNNW